MQPPSRFNSNRCKTYLQGHERPRTPILLSVVSRSEVVLQWAKTLLLAFGFSPDSLLFRNPQTQGWLEGLLACDLIAADVICAQELRGREKFSSFVSSLRSFWNIWARHFHPRV